MMLRCFVFLLLLAGVHGRHEYSQQLEMDLAGEAVEHQGSGESGSRLVTFRNNFQNQTLLLQWTGSLQDDESHMSNPILITEALRGEEIKVNTFDGHIFLIQVKETLKVVGDKVTILEGVDFYEVGPSPSLSSARDDKEEDAGEGDEDRSASRRRQTRARNKRAQEKEQEWEEWQQENEESIVDSPSPPIAIDLVSPPGGKGKAKAKANLQNSQNDRSFLQQPPVKPSPPLRYKKDASLPYPHPNAAITLLGAITTAMSAKFRSLVRKKRKKRKK